MKRVGILGGTFDPPHLAHVLCAAEAREQAGLDEVLLVPAARPPHKPDVALPPRAARLALCEAAAGSLAGVGVSDVEFTLAGRSFTVNTLEALAAAHPDWRLALIIGADQAAALSCWHRAQALCGLARVVVAPRPGSFDAEAILAGCRAVGCKPQILSGPRMELSSTLVRERIAAGGAWRHLVPAQVAGVIDALELYRIRPAA